MEQIFVNTSVMMKLMLFSSIN